MFRLGIPCERHQRRTSWIAKFNVEEFFKGNVQPPVQNYCRGLERSLMIVLLTSKNKYTKVNSQAVLNTH